MKRLLFLAVQRSRVLKLTITTKTQAHGLLFLLLHNGTFRVWTIGKPFFK